MLAIYHSAPLEVISDMLGLVSYEEKVTLLSTPVPNGSRLCLHFASRYSSDLDVIKLITESYPHALLIKSDDGVTPLDRAHYYGKDATILNWLETKTKAHQDIYDIKRYNKELRYVVLNCCKFRWSENNLSEIDLTSATNDGDFVAHMYGYTKERAMIGLFWKVLSYVGEQNIPSYNI